MSAQKQEKESHPFYRLQKELRRLGWYFEWTTAAQPGHMWEDSPYNHEAGPFKGLPLDNKKMLMSCTGESKKPSPFPERYTGNTFYFHPEAKPNILEILPVIVEAGCSHRSIDDSEHAIDIKWPKLASPDNSKRSDSSTKKPQVIKDGRKVIRQYVYGMGEVFNCSIETPFFNGYKIRDVDDLPDAAKKIILDLRSKSKMLAIPFFATKKRVELRFDDLQQPSDIAISTAAYAIFKKEGQIDIKIPAGSTGSMNDTLTIQVYIKED